MNHYLLVLSDQINIRLKGVRSSEEAFGQIVGVSEPVGSELELFKAKEPEKEGRKFRIVELNFWKHGSGNSPVPPPSWK